MVKIIENLRKYFFPKSKKMCLSSKVAELRNELLQNCNYAMDCLEAAEQRVSYFASSNRMRTSTGSSSPPPSPSDAVSGAEPDDATSYEVTDREILNRFMILTHGVLIQEWERFLYDVLVEGVIYYLRGYQLEPDCKLHLKNLRPGIHEAQMRENLSAEVKKSRWGYERLFAHSRKLFKVDEPTLSKEMQKHVQVRHVFQHSKGKIREDDLIAIGMSENVPDRFFGILDDKGQMQKLKEGQEIFLSRPEIQNLRETIEKYSQAFQIQAEKAKQIAE